MAEEIRTYVIGDIAGNYDSLMKLVAQFMPPYRIVALGDVIDRGPKSKEVIEWFRAHPEHTVLMGNHEWMALESVYDWHANGGRATLKSFGTERFLPDDVAEWMSNLPQKYEVEADGKKFLITHAPVPVPGRVEWRESPPHLWERRDPERIPGVDLQIFGHNAHLEVFKDEAGEFAICIDDCHGKPKQLCAIELPSKKVLSQILVE